MFRCLGLAFYTYLRIAVVIVTIVDSHHKEDALDNQ